MRLNVSKKLLPEFVHWQVIVKVEKDRPEKFGRAARPVLERLLQKEGDRDDQTSLVPQVDNNVSQCYFLDPPRLTLHHHQIIQQDRLR